MVIGWGMDWVLVDEILRRVAPQDDDGASLTQGDGEASLAQGDGEASLAQDDDGASLAQGDGEASLAQYDDEVSPVQDEYLKLGLGTGTFLVNLAWCWARSRVPCDLF